MSPTQTEARDGTGRVDPFERFRQVQRMYNAVKGDGGLKLVKSSYRRKWLMSKMCTGNTLKIIRLLAPLREGDDPGDFDKRWIENARSFGAVWAFVVKRADGLHLLVQQSQVAKGRQVLLQDIATDQEEVNYSESNTPLVSLQSPDSTVTDQKSIFISDFDWEVPDYEPLDYLELPAQEAIAASVAASTISPLKVDSPSLLEIELTHALEVAESTPQSQTSEALELEADEPIGKRPLCLIM